MVPSEHYSRARSERGTLRRAWSQPALASQAGELGAILVGRRQQLSFSFFVLLSSGLAVRAAGTTAGGSLIDPLAWCSPSGVCGMAVIGCMLIESLPLTLSGAFCSKST